ncbi:MAG: hypothetical protein KDC24_12830, partial [Saprospiraceae bacterium]|nr:hypothetical protein [Saprospiraceae bacterium]
MPISFDNLHLQIMPLEDFPLKWRFNDEKYDRLPDIHLEQLQPLKKEASNFVWNFVITSGLTEALPFKKDFFKTIDQLKMELHDEKDIKKWLYHRGLPFEKKVILSWQPDEAMIVP